MAGITAVTATYPLDLARTRLSLLPDAHVLPIRSTRGFSTIFINVYSNEGGIRGIYRGLVPTVFGVAPYVGLNFMIYESARSYLTPEGEKGPSALGKLAAGSISGSMAHMYTHPL